MPTSSHDASICEHLDFAIGSSQHPGRSDSENSSSRHPRFSNEENNVSPYSSLADESNFQAVQHVELEECYTDSGPVASRARSAHTEHENRQSTFNRINSREPRSDSFDSYEGVHINPLDTQRSQYLRPASQHSQVDESSGNSKDFERVVTGKFLHHWWFWEVLSMSLSIMSIAAVIILAIKLHRTPISSWTSELAPNTIISALITVAKTTMLVPIAAGISQLKWLQFWRDEAPLEELSVYDEASRGPWGSILLLCSVNERNGRRPLLSLLGAFLTIIALVSGPFAQQIVKFRAEQTREPGIEASIPVCQEFAHYGQPMDYYPGTGTYFFFLNTNLSINTFK
jgi:hypothetical protein